MIKLWKENYHSKWFFGSVIAVAFMLYGFTVDDQKTNLDIWIFLNRHIHLYVGTAYSVVLLMRSGAMKQIRDLIIIRLGEERYFGFLLKKIPLHLIVYLTVNILPLLVVSINRWGSTRLIILYLLILLVNILINEIICIFVVYYDLPNGLVFLTILVNVFYRLVIIERMIEQWL